MTPVILGIKLILKRFPEMWSVGCELPELPDFRKRKFKSRKTVVSVTLLCNELVGHVGVAAFVVKSWTTFKPHYQFSWMSENLVNYVSTSHIYLKYKKEVRSTNKCYFI